MSVCIFVCVCQTVCVCVCVCVCWERERESKFLYCIFERKQSFTTHHVSSRHCTQVCYAEIHLGPQILYLNSQQQSSAGPHCEVARSFVSTELEKQRCGRPVLWGQRAAVVGGGGNADVPGNHVGLCSPHVCPGPSGCSLCCSHCCSANGWWVIFFYQYFKFWNVWVVLRRPPVWWDVEIQKLSN